MFIQKHSKRRTVKANDDIMDPNVVEDEVIEEEVVDGEGEAEVIVDPEATDLLFEAEDVAELLAEVTGETVEVSVEDDSVEFAIGEDVYTVEAEGDEEILEAATRKALRGKRTIAANTRRQVPARQNRQVAAATKTVRRVPNSKKKIDANSIIQAASSAKASPESLISKALKAMKKEGYEGVTIQHIGEDDNGYPTYQFSDGKHEVNLSTYEESLDEPMSVRDFLESAVQVASHLESIQGQQ